MVSEVHPSSPPDPHIDAPDGESGPVGDEPMSFWAHFAELRSRLTRAVLSIVIGFVASFVFSEYLVKFLRVPLDNAWAKTGQEGIADLQVLGIQDPILVDFRVALTAGIFFSLPVIFYQLWMFISPGLYKQEKRFVVPFVMTSIVMFVTGAWFAYQFVLPYGYAFLLDYGGGRGLHVNPELAVYIKGTTRILLAFGVVFEFPLLIAFMAKAGMVTNRTLMKFWRVAVLVIFILAAFLTPPEPMTQIMMAGPMVILFFISVVVAYVINPYVEPEEIPGLNDEDELDEDDFDDARHGEDAPHR
jgi:sec-independent protein translocase protein TatC